MIRVCTVVGARPQFVKASVVSRAFKDRGDIHETIIHTGQHYDANMSTVFFTELGIPNPDHNLGVGSARHGAQTGRIMERLEPVLLNVGPDCVLVYGDTNSTLAAAVVASKLHFPVAHVEAGLRSFNRRMPEELNRILTDHCSTLLFPPTERAKANLAAEGIVGDRVRQVGDVMLDVAKAHETIIPEVESILANHRLVSGAFILATIHRAENTDDPTRLASIFDGLARVARVIPVLIPVHPRTRSIISTLSSESSLESIFMIEPVGYLSMLGLVRSCALVATDSGGLQKEAFFCRKPCVTLRSETEWVELVELGWNRTVPNPAADCVAEVILTSLGTKGTDAAPYGDGRASSHIAAAIAEIEF